MYKYILILLLFSNTCNAEFFKLEPINKRQHQCPVLQDIMQQTNDSEGYDCLSTKSHEYVHGVNSRIRQMKGTGHNGFYLLNNRACCVKEPRHFKLADLAQAIPGKYRKQIYQLYLIDAQQWWNNEPSYIMDEHVAYMAGTVCALKRKDNYRADDSGFRTLETAVYCVYLKKLAKQKDIDEIVDFQVKRCHELYKRLPKENPKVTENYNNLQEVLKIQ